jgi:anti-sigma factor RsiW
VNGEIFYHLRNLWENSALAGVIRSAYPQPALVPASPWLNSFPPNKPGLTATIDKNSGATASWQSAGEPARLWVLQFHGTDNVWTTEILPAGQTTKSFLTSLPEVIAIRAVDRAGNLSPPAAVKKSLVPVRNGKGMMIVN